jgi:hypothetical protein
MTLNIWTIGLLVVFALFWMFVLYRFLRAVSHFANRASQRVEAIRRQHADDAGDGPVERASMAEASAAGDDRI